MAKFIDDQMDHLESDVEKIRVRYRQYISYSNEEGAKSVVLEIINNALDECRNPRSPGNLINIEFDERSGFIHVTDNGRGISTTILEKLFTSLNFGSNIRTGKKASLKAETLGQNGTGTLAACGLGERTEIVSYRGGTENIFKRLIFEEGKKISEEDGKCPSNKHGMSILFKPSKVMGKSTKIVWKDIKYELESIQFLNNKNISINSVYIDKGGQEVRESYKIQPFENILSFRNDKSDIISNKIHLIAENDNIIEDVDGESIKRFLSVDVAFAYTSSLSPYIDSFSNTNNTVDNGDHLEGVLEAICRYFQQVTKNVLSEREKSSLDIKWDDVKSGLSIVVSIRTNYESLYTGQTKHKIVSKELRKIIQDLTLAVLPEYFNRNTSQLKEIVNLVKTNAKARHEGDKVRQAVVKGSLSNWSAHKMKNYDPCTNKGKEYKELFIVEGDSAKGTLKKSKDPKFQALFAIRGVSANVYKLSADQIVGPKGNKEFTDLVTVMGCNIGPKFDLNKLNFNKIIIATDADVDGLGIRSLLMSFFFKLFPEIIMDGRLFIAEPPLYRVRDSKNPFVINKEDYIDRYVNSVVKDYKLGIIKNDDRSNISYFSNKILKEFLSDTSAYVDDITMIQDHYEVSDRIIEMIVEELATLRVDKSLPLKDILEKINIQSLMNRIGTEFKGLYFEEKDNMIEGHAEGKYQLLELSEALVRKCLPLVSILENWRIGDDECLLLKSIKKGTEYQLSVLGVLKILKRYQPDVLHRFKGLGENDDEDIKITVMDPNTRTLIKVNILDIENDMAVFQKLRGTSPIDAENRRIMMQNYQIPRDLIDT